MQSKLIDVIKQYYEHRGYAMPDADSALIFLVSEIGEVCDADVNTRGKWIRNNSKSRDVKSEIADVLQMLYVYAYQRGIDPLTALQEKYARYGFQFPADLFG